MKTGEPPASLVVLNDWIYAQHLPPLPKFHEKHPSVEMEGLDRKFYAQMRPLKFSEREPQEEGKDRKPHRVWDEKEADRGNSKDLQPLEDWPVTQTGRLRRFLCSTSNDPTMGGLLVAKVLFNGLSYKCITSNTKPASLPSVTPSRPSPPRCCPLLLVARRTQRCSGHRHCHTVRIILTMKLNR